MKPNHPLKSDGKSWDQNKVLEVLLPRLETMSLEEAVAEYYVTADGKKFGMPTRWTIHQWADECPQLANSIARARKKRAAHLADEALKLVDQEPPKDSRGSMDRGHVRWAESRANMRKWLAERLDPDQFGAKTQVDVHHHGSIDISQVLHDARARVIEGSAIREEPPALGNLADAADLFD